MQTCPRCRSENLIEVRFCANCGFPLEGSGTLVERPSPTSSKKPVPPPMPERRETIVDRPIEPKGPERPPTHYEGSAFGQTAAGRPVPPEAVPGARPKATQFMQASAPPSEAPSPSVLRTDDRKIVGVLLTYSWRPAGQIFPVREGRNIIGRGTGCDICIPEDESLSEKHAHITYRKDFVIGDLVSMGGTYVNGEPIEEQFVRLQNYVEIRTGSTQWRFVALELPH